MIITYTGDSYFQLQYGGNGLDSATALDSWILRPPKEFPYYCYFYSGQNVGLVDNIVLTGQTSGAVIEVGRVITTDGTLGGSDAKGVIFFRSRSGNITSGENLRVSTTTYCIAGSGELKAPIGQQARTVFITVETNSIRLCFGGATPTSSTDTPASFGTLVAANGSISNSSWKDISDLKIINAVEASNATVNIVVSF